MYKVNLLFLKIIRKISLLKRLNFTFSRYYNRKKVIIPFINGIGFENYIKQPNWLDNLIQLFVKENDGAFVDVGVNIGQTLLRVKTALPNIHYIGFEPNATCTFYTQQLIRKNNFTNSLVYNCALSTKVQNILLEKSLGDDKRASIVSGLRPHTFVDAEPILAVDFDALSFNDKIAFVKIDVEGAELEVLTGMKKMIENHQPIITCEVLDAHSKEQFDFTQDRANKVFELLSLLHYSVIQLQTTTQGIVSYNKVNAFQLKEWTPDSYALNDYIFYPIAKENEVMNALKLMM